MCVGVMGVCGSDGCVCGVMGVCGSDGCVWD